MEFDFEILHRPRLYRPAADAMSRLPQADIGSPSKDKGVDNDIPTYCVMEQESDVCSTSDDEDFTVLTMSKPKDLLDDQPTDF